MSRRRAVAIAILGSAALLAAPVLLVAGARATGAQPHIAIAGWNCGRWTNQFRVGWEDTDPVCREAFYQDALLHGCSRRIRNIWFCYGPKYERYVVDEPR